MPPVSSIKGLEKETKENALAFLLCGLEFFWFGIVFAIFRKVVNALCYVDVSSTGVCAGYGTVGAKVAPTTAWQPSSSSKICSTQNSDNREVCACARAQFPFPSSYCFCRIKTISWLLVWREGYSQVLFLFLFLFLFLLLLLLVASAEIYFSSVKGWQWQSTRACSVVHISASFLRLKNGPQQFRMICTSGITISSGHFPARSSRLLLISPCSSSMNMRHKSPSLSLSE